MPGTVLVPPLPSGLSSSPFDHHVWFPPLRRELAPTLFVYLPASFISSLLSGHVHVQPNAADLPSQTRIEWSDGTVDTLQPESRTPDESGVERGIASAISQLGGAVCPKVDGVCPTDAAWVNFDRCIKCVSVDDVLTLLKSSERVMAVLQPDREAVLALRQWEDVDPRMQFRLFVREKAIVGISHRFPQDAIHFSVRDADDLVLTLESWFQTRVRDVFVAANSYVLDVFLIRRRHVRLVDVTQWRTGDALLFTWEELDDAGWMTRTKRAQFRTVSNAPMRPSPSLYHGLPLELRSPDAATNMVQMAQRLVNQQGVDDSEGVND